MTQWPERNFIPAFWNNSTKWQHTPLLAVWDGDSFSPPAWQTRKAIPNVNVNYCYLHRTPPPIPLLPSYMHIFHILRNSEIMLPSFGRHVWLQARLYLQYFDFDTWGEEMLKKWRRKNKSGKIKREKNWSKNTQKKIDSSTFRLCCCESTLLILSKSWKWYSSRDSINTASAARKGLCPWHL